MLEKVMRWLNTLSLLFIYLLQIVWYSVANKTLMKRNLHMSAITNTTIKW